MGCILYVVIGFIGESLYQEYSLGLWNKVSKKRDDRDIEAVFLFTLNSSL